MTNPEHMPSDDAMKNDLPGLRGVSSLNTPLYLRDHLFADQRGYLALFSGARGLDARKLLACAERYFSWPDEAGSAVECALAESNRGSESYFCAHLLTGTTPLSEHGCSSSAVTQKNRPDQGGEDGMSGPENDRATSKGAMARFGPAVLSVDHTRSKSKV